MGRALFYHLTHSGVADVVRRNAARALEQGWRVAVRGTDTAMLERLSERLWLHPADGFLPHGLTGGPHDADQPILLGTGGADLAAGRQALLVLGGAAVTAAEVAALERVWVVFDGADPAGLAVARDQWRALTAAGAVAEYWSERSGRWQMEQRRPATP